jgi:hypothetical protein
LHNSALCVLKLLSWWICIGNAAANETATLLPDHSWVNDCHHMQNISRRSTAGYTLFLKIKRLDSILFAKECTSCVAACVARWT